MCGITGVFGESSIAADEMSETMLQLCVLRGPHSTGLAFANPQGVAIHKDVVLPQLLLGRPEVQACYRKTNNFLILGHNRFATRGKVTQPNAHPFQHENILLAHNGTLVSQWDLPDGSKFDTDSEAITHAIAVDGIKKTWPKLNGPTVLVYYDLNEHTLNIVCNGRRPIFWARNKSKKAIFFASESWMIRQSAIRNNIELDADVLYPAPNVLFTFDMEGRKSRINTYSEKLEEWKAPTYTHYGATNYQARRHNDKFIWEDEDSYYNPDTRRWEIRKEDKKEAGGTNIVPFVGKTESGDTTAAQSKSQNSIGEVVSGDGTGDVPFNDATVDLFTDADFSKLTEKNMAEEEFHKQYVNCCFCNDPLDHDYEGSVILDSKSAACSGCADTANREGLDVRLVQSH